MEDAWNKNKEMGDAEMLEAATEYGNPFCILFFKYTDYVMVIMALWMTHDDMYGSNTKRNYKGRDGDSLVKMFKYWQPFGFNFY